MAVESTMLPLGTSAPAFTLPDPAGAPHVLDDLAADGPLVVAFVCNHCPYVRHIAETFARVAVELVARGATVIAINSNDSDAYPDDAPPQMVEFARRHGWTFPYLVDADQDVARAYGAVCTPDFFVFDGDRRLAYRGRFDASRPGGDAPSTGEDLVDAVESLLDGGTPPSEQWPSIGCGIKWRPGTSPH